MPDMRWCLVSSLGASRSEHGERLEGQSTLGELLANLFSFVIVATLSSERISDALVRSFSLPFLRPVVVL